EAPSRDRQDPLNPGLICMRMVLAMNRWLIGSPWIIGCIGFSRGFFILILLSAELAPVEESDDLNIPDAAPVDPVLKAGAFPNLTCICTNPL
nr:hypothetical protein [Tanacetum cinerariifolium]